MSQGYAHVNGKPCKVLRDSAATLDVVRPSYVTSEDFTGAVTWIKQVLEEHSVCLPMARVEISGPFGKLVTEAAVSKTVPLEYPYLFSNRSDRLLRERGQFFGEGKVQALTRSKTRQLAAQLTQDMGQGEAEIGAEPEIKKPNLVAEQGVEVVARSGDIDAAAAPSEPQEIEPVGASILAPSSRSIERLLEIDRDMLKAEQKNDPSLRRLHATAEKGIARRNITILEKGGLLYRHYRDRKGKPCDQLVIPEKYRADLLRLCHGNSWSGHLGMKKTKERLLMEYYWPGCFKDVERYVKSCDACQRVGKPENKMEVQWEGPVEIQHRLSAINYVLKKIGKRNEVTIYHLQL
ncbi:uncharacterized protein LOC144100768 [Amblyomma americanum]